VDWSRAKTILILSFLFLNAVLGYQLWTGKVKQTGLASDMTGMIEDTKRLLRQKNIQAPADFPKEAPKLKGITVKYDDSFKSNQKVPLQNHFKLNMYLTRNTYRDIASRMEIRKLSEYQYDAVASKQGVYIFNQMHSGLPMFDVKLELFEENGEITSYRQEYAEVDPGAGGDQKEQKVIPAYIAVRSLIDNYQLDGAVITSIRLGYHGQMFNSQPQYMVPTWRVVLGNGDMYYIHGFNGAVEGPQEENVDEGKNKK
jgi:regulatory protein YycI of two-component signal transduction system YycFG